MADNGKWIQGAVERMEKKGTIGSFSSAAKKNRMSTKAFANKDLSSPNASPAMKKKANFAKNVMQ